MPGCTTLSLQFHNSFAQTKDCRIFTGSLSLFLWKEEENYYNKSPPDFGVVRGRSTPGSHPEAFARGGVCFVYV